MYKQTHTQQLDILQQELNMLRSLIIGSIGKDKEGNYNPQFIKKILRASKEKPTHSFRDKKSFLKQLD